MQRKGVVSIVSLLHDAYKHEEAISEKRDLGLLLAKKGYTVLTDFSPMSQYVKESVLEAGGTLLSLSPAANKKEHEEIFRFTTVEGEVVIYTGLGHHLAFMTLCRSADIVICLDENSFLQAKQAKDTDESAADVYELKKSLMSLLETL